MEEMSDRRKKVKHAGGGDRICERTNYLIAYLQSSGGASATAISASEFGIQGILKKLLPKNDTNSSHNDLLLKELNERRSVGRRCCIGRGTGKRTSRGKKSMLSSFYQTAQAKQNSACAWWPAPQQEKLSEWGAKAGAWNNKRLQPRHDGYNIKRRPTRKVQRRMYIFN